jgi:hypothetical protein
VSARRIEIARVRVHGLPTPPGGELAPRIQAELGRALSSDGANPRAAVAVAVGSALRTPVRELGAGTREARR